MGFVLVILGALLIGLLIVFWGVVDVYRQEEEQWVEQCDDPISRDEERLNARSASSFS